MKNFIYAALAVCTLSVSANAQNTSANDKRARAIYPKAVELYNNKEYKAVLTKIQEMEKALGGSNARLYYLKTKASYALADYNTAEASCKAYFESLPKHDPGYVEMTTIKESILAYRSAERAREAEARAEWEQAETDRKAREAEEERARKLQMQAAAQRRADYAVVQEKIDAEEVDAYKAAQKTNTKAAYQSFLYDYPNGKYHGMALSEMKRKWPYPLRTLKSSKYGYSLNGKLVVKAKYDNASDFAEDLARVGKDGKYGFVNANGVEVIPIKYVQASNFNYGAAAVKNADGSCYFITADGNKLVDQKYADTKSFSEGLAACQDSETYLYGFINNKGEQKIDFLYNAVSWFKEGNCAVGKIVNGAMKFAYIDSKGLQLCPFMYDEAKDFQGYVARVKLNNKYGLVDRFGSQITCCDYDYISEFKNDGYALAKRNKLEVYLDKEGQSFAKVNGKYVQVNF